MHRAVQVLSVCRANFEGQRPTHARRVTSAERATHGPLGAALQKPMSLDEFRAWAEQQELRWEFDGFEPVAMTGGTVAHGQIQLNILRRLGDRLDGKTCRVFGSELSILVAGSIRYPDAFVTCEPVADDATVVTEPVVIFEILSPSTATNDFGVKNREYRDTPSVQHYVLLEQGHQAATVFSRMGEKWMGIVVTGDEILALPEIGIELPLEELYRGISLGRTGT